MPPPRLETDRLILDAHRREDLEPFAEMWADPEIVRHLGYGPWIVRDKRSGRFVGEVGFADFLRNVQPSVGPYPETGWVLARWAHGQGFATEALAAAIEWLKHERTHAKIYCLVGEESRASIRVAEKNGFSFSGIVHVNEKPVNAMIREL